MISLLQRRSFIAHFLKLGVAPEAFEAVVFARLRIEDMHDEIHEVEQDPMRALAALDMPRLHAFFGKLLGDVIGNGAHLRVDGAGADDEEIRYARELAQIEDFHVFGFHFERKLCGLQCGFVRLLRLRNARARVRLGCGSDLRCDGNLPDKEVL